MRVRSLLTILLILSLSAASCRTRRAVPPPAAEPPVAEATAPEPPATSVPAPETEFRQTQPEPDVLSGDIVEANRVARDRGWIRDAFFAFDASTLDAGARAALESTAQWLRSRPELTIRVEGHCDERGTEQYNLALGDRRADTAADYLETLGIARERITTISYGEEKPFETGSTEEAWARNRRAHIVLAGRR